MHAPINAETLEQFFEVKKDLKRHKGVYPRLNNIFKVDNRNLMKVRLLKIIRRKVNLRLTHHRTTTEDTAKAFKSLDFYHKVNRYVY